MRLNTLMVKIWKFKASEAKHGPKNALYIAVNM